MKFLFALLMLFASSVFAETITFTGSGCYATRICFDVATDDETDTVNLYANPSYRPILYLNGIAYVGTTAGYGTLTGHEGTHSFYTVDQDMTAAGEEIPFGHMTVNFEGWSTLNRSGHNYYVHHWLIKSGNFTR